MHERPIGDLVDALTQLGCRIDYLGNPGYPPLRIHAGRRWHRCSSTRRSACAATCRASS